ncbi:MAG TPA: PQQ-binding-like beta-propeller repeat protein, partial [Ktedonobacteraceae bacterium]|nr:PQQ-binding-like beta-propeller repeat protein [Ktedonobacteraceae bacterium]
MRLQQDNYTNTSVRVRWWKKPLSAKALMQIFLVCVCCGLFALTSGRALDAVRASSNVVGAQDWNQYLHDPQNTAASNETILSTANVSQLTRLWTFKTGAGIAAGAAVVGNTVYVGSWDGYEYALDLATGAQKWKTFLGQSVNKECQPSTIGVTSSALVDNGTIYVGGGDNYWYALDAATGNVLWKVDTGDNSAAGGHYNWSSPLIANGFAYIGIASNCDLPLVQGQLWKVDLSSHQVVGKTSFVPDGQVGGGVWTRPAIDSATNTIYVTTGTQSLFTQTLPQAIVSVDAATMAIKDSWQIPLQESNIDADFGNSPILFTDARGRQLVAATNKNGYTYAWDRAHLSAGPVWQQATNIGGECPVCGDGSVSSGAYADGRLFLAGGNAVINGVGFAGVVRALDPTTGAYLWEHALPNPVIPAIVYDNGLLIDASGPTIEVLDAATGHRLYSYQTGFTSYGPPAVANGTIIEGSGDGVIYALALSTKTVTPP